MYDFATSTHYLSIDRDYIKRPLKVQKTCARLIFGIKKFDRVPHKLCIIQNCTRILNIIQHRTSFCKHQLVYVGYFHPEPRNLQLRWLFQPTAEQNNPEQISRRTRVHLIKARPLSSFFAWTAVSALGARTRVCDLKRATLLIFMVSEMNGEVYGTFTFT